MDWAFHWKGVSVIFSAENQGAFTNYVDKTRQLGVTGNVNGMQISPYNRKGIPSQMSTWGSSVVKKGQNLVNVVKEYPLMQGQKGYLPYCIGSFQVLHSNDAITMRKRKKKDRIELNFYVPHS